MRDQTVNKKQTCQSQNINCFPPRFCFLSSFFLTFFVKNTLKTLHQTTCISFFFPINVIMAFQQTGWDRTSQLPSIFILLPNSTKINELPNQFWPASIILGTWFLIPSYLDKFGIFVMEKVKLTLVKAMLERNIYLTLINWRRSSIAPTLIDFNNSKIGEISCKVITFSS